MKKIIIPLFILILVGGFILIKAKNSKNGQDKNIKLVKVQRGSIYEKALAIGRIDPKNEIAIKSKTSGIIKKVLVEVGDYVRPGQLMIEIQPNPTPLEYAEAKRNVELASVDLEKAMAEYNRMKQLSQQKLVSQREFEIAENERKPFELKLNLSKERLALIDTGRIKIADQEIDNNISSPTEGTVLERRVNPGDPVVPLTSYQAGTELLILADMKSLIFKGTVDEIDVGKIKEGMAAELKIGAIPDQIIKGRVSRISPKAKKQENATLFDVEIEIVEKGNKVIRAGYSANADLVINKSENTLFIPERLVSFTEDKSFVEIKTGLSDGINLEILEGLKEGDEIVEQPPKEIM